MIGSDLVKDVDVHHLPADVEQLHQLISDLVVEHERSLADQRRAYQELSEKFEVLRRMHFGQSSEKLTEEDRRQMHLFNEAEQGVEPPLEVPGPQAGGVHVAEHQRAKPGRKPIAEHLPREVVIHDLDDEDKHCPCCGTERPVVSEETSEEVEVIPAKVKVIRHVRRVYGPCRCEAFDASGALSMIRSPMPPRMIPGSIAGPGFLAYVLTAKFVDSLPFYRQERIFSRLGIEVARATLCSWAISAAARCGPLIELMWQRVREGPLVRMDETTVQVPHERGRPASADSYMWVTLGLIEQPEPAVAKPVVLYHYHPTRSGAVATSALVGYRGYLQTDGYDGYNEIGGSPGIIHVGCWAHARRKFFEASKITKKSGSAEVALAFIAELYRIETTLRTQLAKEKISRRQFLEQRSAQVKPNLDRFRAWLDERLGQVVPSSKLGEAIHYTHAQWPRLERYLDAWFLTPDNNATENAIRPFVVGRKNWLFSDTPRGAHASAALYSLVETAKANGLEPYHYLRFLFDRLPQATQRQDYERLVPTALSPSDLLDLNTTNRPR